MEDFYYEVLCDAASERGLDLDQTDLKYMAKACADAASRLEQEVREGLST